MINVQCGVRPALKLSNSAFTHFHCPRHREILRRLPAADAVPLGHFVELSRQRHTPSAADGPTFRYIEIGSVARRLFGGDRTFRQHASVEIGSGPQPAKVIVFRPKRWRLTSLVFLEAALIEHARESTVARRVLPECRFLTRTAPPYHAWQQRHRYRLRRQSRCPSRRHSCHRQLRQ